MKLLILVALAFVACAHRPPPRPPAPVLSCVALAAPDGGFDLFCPHPVGAP